jgi:CBS domain-containing protein
MSTQAARRLGDPIRPDPPRPAVTVADVMNRGVLSCRPDVSLTEIARTMVDHRVHGVVVAGVRRDAAGGEHLVWGVVSDLDVAGAVATLGDEEPTAADLSSTPGVVVGPGDRLAEAARLMHDYDVHHLVVVSSPDRRPVGVLSTLDVARAIAEGRV